MNAAISMAAACLRIGAPRKISGHNLRMRNQATDAADSFAASQIGDKLDFACAFEKQSNNQHDCQCDERMQMEQWHRCVNRKLDPPRQGTFAVAADSVDSAAGIGSESSACAEAAADSRLH